MNSTPYAALNAVLLELTRGVQGILQNNLVGVYLTGSFALGDFDEHSDVDFAVVTERELSDAHLEQLQAMHGRIFQLETSWAQHLEGSYVSRDALRAFDPKQKLWYIDNGSSRLEPSTHDNTLVVRWVTRAHGIALFGPEASTLIEAVNPDALRAEVRAVMRDWGDKLLESPADVNNRWRQPFVVLSYCRMLQTLETATITSKLEAARWGQRRLDAHWHGLIERAWLERPNPSLKFKQTADPVDLEATLAFVRYALEVSGERPRGTT